MSDNKKNEEKLAAEKAAAEKAAAEKAAAEKAAAAKKDDPNVKEAEQAAAKKQSKQDLEKGIIEEAFKLESGKAINMNKMLAYVRSLKKMTEKKK